MAEGSIILSPIYFLIMLLIWESDEVNIHLYRNQNFTGLLWHSNSTAGCFNTPDDKHVEVHSIKTDTCFIVYEQSNCNSRWSMKFMPGDINLSENEITYTFSFQTCNDEEGGNQLNVDITKHYEYRFVTAPDVLHSFKNVCSCINIPKHVQNLDKWSINNHHNSLLTYYEPNCSEDKWNSKYITAGQNTDSREMQNHKLTDNNTNKTYTIQSFQPDPNSLYYKTSCLSSELTNKNDELVDSKKIDNFENTTFESSVNADDVTKNLEVLIHKVGEIQTHVEQSKQSQDHFQNETESILNEQKAKFDKLTEQILKFQRNVESSLRILNRTCTKCQCN